MDGNEISAVKNTVRDLGININKSLKWNSHIDIITKNARSRLFCLFKALRSNNPEFLTKMYTAYVRPLLEFSSSVFNPYTKQNIKKIESVQATACNMIYYRCLQKKYNDKPNYEILLNELSLELLQTRRLKADLLLFHKIILAEIPLNCTSSPQLKQSQTRGNKIKSTHLSAQIILGIISFLLKLLEFMLNYLYVVQ
jgi:hypothetical protein